MKKILASASLVLALGVAAAPLASMAQDKAKTQAGPGEKVCRYKFPDGERRTWVCKKDEPCCAWDAIKYTKCGFPGVLNCI